MAIAALIVAVVLGALAGGDDSAARTELYRSHATFEARDPIDQLVLGQLRKLGITPAGLCTDAVFLRRACLDVLGTLPTAREAREFLQDPAPDKRERLIDRLLQRDEFADYWAMKWCDLLRVKAEYPINLWPNAVQAYHRWIRTSLKENLPYDRFVREMLTASGSNFRVPPANFYRATQSKEPTALAQTVALTFMGSRVEHWPAQELASMAAFFAQLSFKTTAEWKEEVVFFDPDRPFTNAVPSFGRSPEARFPDGTPARLEPGQDPRLVFTDWLVNPRNPWFTRNIVNRIWSWLLGRGIVHEPDDLRPDNPPCIPDLLPLLERELLASGYDLKRVYRLILNSRTYQLSSLPADGPANAVALFARYPLRRLEAEVLIDALCQLTGTTEKYTSAIPEPFTVIPEGQRSIGLADGSITSPFLELFGRPPRDTGLESERNNRFTAAQRLHLLNSSHIQRKLEQGRTLQALFQSRRPPRQTVVDLYLTILSRFPTNDELRLALEYVRSNGDRPREAAEDLVWALVNSTEFLYRH